MSANTKIEWCDHSWSPWRGCTKVSAGCANCYAETLSKRNPAVLGQWGKGKPRVMAKDWNDPVKWNRSGYVCAECGKSSFSDRCMHGQCRGATHRIRVFPSLCDWLDEEVPLDLLAKFLKLIHDTPNLDWLLLTKRPESFHKRMALAFDSKTDGTGRDGDFWQWLLNWWAGIAPSNVWVGASVEDQPNMDRRGPELLKIPAKVRFLSVEPMLGPVDLKLDQIEVESEFRHADDCKGFCDFACGGEEVKGGIDWVIVGGESGHNARPCNVDGIRDVVRQCATAHVPCFVKQVGSHCVDRRSREVCDPKTRWPDRTGVDAFTMKLNHPKGGDPAEWPEDLCVRLFPEVKP